MGCVLVLAAAPLSAQVKPRLIDDINELADGRGGDPAQRPWVFPRTGSSFPDTPKAVDQLLFFTAHESDGLRRLYRFASETYDTKAVEYATTLPTNPRFLTPSQYSAPSLQALYFVADLPITEGNKKHHSLFAVGDGQATLVAFPNNIVLSEIDAVVATTDNISVLATTKTDAAGADRVQAIWTSTAGGPLVSQYPLATERDEVGNFVYVPGSPSFYAFSCRGQTLQHRALMVRNVAAAAEATIALTDPNPAMLTPLGSMLLFVDYADYGTNGDDHLQLLVGPNGPLVSIVLAPRIRNLAVTSVGSTYRMLCSTGGEHPLVTLSSDSGFLFPEAATSITSVAATASHDGQIYILGSQAASVGSDTMLWRFEPGKVELDELQAFAPLQSAHSLSVWTRAGVTRFAFGAHDILTNTPCIRVNAANGSWPPLPQPVEDVVPGTMPDLLVIVGDYVFLRAFHLDRGCEPWAWAYP